MKLAEIAERDEQIAAVGTDARERSALAHGAAIHFEARRAEGARAGIERHRHHIVAHLAIGIEHRILARIVTEACRIAHGVEFREGCHTII